MTNYLKISFHYAKTVQDLLFLEATERSSNLALVTEYNKRGKAN